MEETLNNQGEQGGQTEHRHHHHHHHRSSSDTSSGSSSSRHHHHSHHHHHSSVRVISGNRLRRLPWLTGLGLIIITLVVFFIMVMCTKFV